MRRLSIRLIPFFEISSWASIHFFEKMSSGILLFLISIILVKDLDIIVFQNWLVLGKGIFWGGGKESFLQRLSSSGFQVASFFWTALIFCRIAIRVIISISSWEISFFLLFLYTYRVSSGGKRKPISVAI